MLTPIDMREFKEMSDKINRGVWDLAVSILGNPGSIEAIGLNDSRTQEFYVASNSLSPLTQHDYGLKHPTLEPGQEPYQPMPFNWASRLVELAEKHLNLRNILSSPDHLTPPEYELITKALVVIALRHQIEEKVELHADFTNHNDMHNPINRELADYMDYQGRVARRVGERLDSISFEEPYSTDLSMLVECAFELHEGTISQNGELVGDYETFMMVEQERWWKNVADLLNEEKYSEFNSRWHRAKQYGLDDDVKESMGRLSGWGYILDWLEDKTTLRNRGDKKIQHGIEEIAKLIKKLRRKSLIPAITASRKIYRKNKEDLASQLEKLISDEIRADTEKIIIACKAIEKSDIKLPPDLQECRERIDLVAGFQDRQVDARKNLQKLNILRLLSMVMPTVYDWSKTVEPPQELPSSPITLLHDIVIAQRDPKSVVSHHLNSLIVGLMSFLNTEELREELIVASEKILTELRYAPADRYGIREVVDILLNPDLAVHPPIGVIEGVESYPVEIQSQLMDLETLRNENYMTFDQILEGAVNAYNKKAGMTGDSMAFWQTHHEGLDLADVVSGILPADTLHSYEGSLPTSLQIIYEKSDKGFNGYHDVAALYYAIHYGTAGSGNLPPVNAEDVRLYFSDYFDLLLRAGTERHQLLTTEELLTFALEKNNGDVAAALWDIAIVSKIFTRYDLSTAFPINLLSQRSRLSGDLVLGVVRDNFSPTYTMQNLAEVVSLSEFPFLWDSNGTYLNKDYDPANIAGTWYHILGTLAFLDRLPSSAIGMGVLYEFTFGSGGVAQHGVNKMSNQLGYIADSLDLLGSYLSALPSQPSASSLNQPNDQGTYIITQSPYNQRYFDPGGGLMGELYTGDMVSFQMNGETLYARLCGNPSSPYILASKDPSFVTQPITMSQLLASQHINQAEIEGITDYEVREPGSVPSLNLLSSDIKNSLLYQYIIVSINSGVFTTDQIPDSLIAHYRTQEFLEYLKLADESWQVTILAHHEVFSPSSEVMLEAISSTTVPFSMSTSMSYIDAEEALKNMLEKNQDLSLQSIFNAFRTNPNLGWKEISLYPGLFSEIMSMDDVSEMIMGGGEYGFFVCYGGWTGVFPELTPARIYELLSQSETAPVGSYVLRYPELFMGVIDPKDIDMIISRGGGMSLIEAFELWSEYFGLTPQSMYEKFVDFQIEDWGSMLSFYSDFFVGTLPEKYRDAFINSGGNEASWQVLKEPSS